ncbi:MAG TPA: hypothetical protein PLJ21_00390 [Pseudobdellovibrionaceae bacterium]|nr:hypothetical protein [Pseudobdellovibrionaceae bacterium]
MKITVFLSVLVASIYTQAASVKCKATIFGHNTDGSFNIDKTVFINPEDFKTVFESDDLGNGLGGALLMVSNKDPRYLFQFKKNRHQIQTTISFHKDLPKENGKSVVVQHMISSKTKNVEYTRSEIIDQKNLIIKEAVELECVE